MNTIYIYIYINCIFTVSIYNNVPRQTSPKHLFKIRSLGPENKTHGQSKVSARRSRSWPFPKPFSYQPHEGIETDALSWKLVVSLETSRDRFFLETSAAGKLLSRLLSSSLTSWWPSTPILRPTSGWIPATRKKMQNVPGLTVNLTHLASGSISTLLTPMCISKDRGCATTSCCLAAVRLSVIPAHLEDGGDEWRSSWKRAIAQQVVTQNRNSCLVRHGKQW